MPEPVRNILTALETFAKERDGDLAIGYGKGEWSVALTWGREARQVADMATAARLGEAIEEFSAGRSLRAPLSDEPHHPLRRHLLEVLGEAVTQDRKVSGDPPEVWTPHRNGVRSYLAALEDEIREAREAWDDEKKPAGEADPARWPKTRAELVQVSAVGLRAVRALSPEPATGVGGSSA